MARETIRAARITTETKFNLDGEGIARYLSLKPMESR